MLSALLAVSALGALGAAWLGGKMRLAIPLVSAMTFQLAALALLMFAGSLQTFALGVLLYSLAWAFAPLYLHAMLVAHDRDGRLIMFAPAAQAVGAGAGPLLAAMIMQQGSVLGIGSLAAVLLVLTVACVLAGTTRGRGYPVRIS